MLKNVEELADPVKLIFYLRTTFRTLIVKTTGMENKTKSKCWHRISTKTHRHLPVPMLSISTILQGKKKRH